jgi:hypothetical protein
MKLLRDLLLQLLVLGGLVGLTLEPVAAQPRIVDIVPKSAAAGLGQLIVIQGFDLFPDDAPVVTLTPTSGGSPTTCAFVFPAASSPNELYVRLGVFELPNPPGCSNAIPSWIAPGKYRLTVTTAEGISNAIGFQVKETAMPIPRQLLACSASGACSPGSTFSPGSLMGIRAYGTDTSGATAVFIQGTTVIAVPSGITFIGGGDPEPSDDGLVNGFEVPTGLSAGRALVRLRTTVTAIGGGQPDPSSLSFGLVFEVAAPPILPSD